MVLHSPLPADGPAGIPLPTAVGLALDFATAFHSPRHHHAEAQLVYAQRGVITVTVADATHVVPPNRAVWVPARLEHQTTSHGAVAFRTVFFPESLALSHLPPCCTVVAVSPLLRELILRAVSHGHDYPPDSFAARVAALLLEEMHCLPDQPLRLPMPHSPRLMAWCQDFLSTPGIGLDVDTAARQMAQSRRSFLRHFQQETGLSFGQWRQQACLLSSLPRLAAGEPVLTIALDLGYSSPSAFSALFRRTLGMAPRDYCHSR